MLEVQSDHVHLFLEFLGSRVNGAEIERGGIGHRSPLEGRPCAFSAQVFIAQDKARELRLLETHLDPGPAAVHVQPVIIQLVRRHAVWGIVTAGAIKPPPILRVTATHETKILLAIGERDRVILETGERVPCHADHAIAADRLLHGEILDAARGPVGHPDMFTEFCFIATDGEPLKRERGGDLDRRTVARLRVALGEQRSLVDPGPKHGHLIVVERFVTSGRGHFHAFDQPRHVMNERASSAVARNDRDPHVSPAHGRLAVGQAVAAPGTLARVAAVAGVLENGEDIAVELDLDVRRRRQLPEVQLLRGHRQSHRGECIGQPAHGAARDGGTALVWNTRVNRAASD